MMRRTWILAPVAAAVLTLASCGGGSSASTDGSQAGGTTSTAAAAKAPAGAHNAADVMFAQMMIPHHAQAIDMAKLAPTRAASTQVKGLAAQIEAAQDPEIVTMQGWLSSWGESDPMSDMDMSHGSDGMMSEADMTKLKGLSGRAFDREFLTMMTEHHRSAIEMARTEQTDGAYQPAKKLAAAIVTGQTAEVAKMGQLLKQL